MTRWFYCVCVIVYQWKQYKILYYFFQKRVLLHYNYYKKVKPIKLLKHIFNKKSMIPRLGFPMVFFSSRKIKKHTHAQCSCSCAVLKLSCHRTRHFTNLQSIPPKAACLPAAICIICKSRKSSRHYFQKKTERILIFLSKKKM